MDKDTAANAHQWQCDRPPRKFLAHWRDTRPGNQAGSWGLRLAPRSRQTPEEQTCDYCHDQPPLSRGLITAVFCKLTVRAVGWPPPWGHATADTQGSCLTVFKPKNHFCWCASSLMHCLKPPDH